VRGVARVAGLIAATLAVVALGVLARRV
jgi:hypothetical protein